MPPDLETEEGRWRRQADEDLLTARRLVELERYYAACFFAQQAAEKATKAVLYGRGAESVRGHSVAELWADVAGEDDALKAHQAAAATLDTFYIPTRYPDALPSGVPADAYDVETAQRAVSLAATLVTLSRSLREP